MRVFLSLSLATVACALLSGCEKVSSAICQLAQTAPGDWADSVPSKYEGEAARIRALDHLHTALASLGSKSRRREAWMQGALLLLRVHTSPWYFCASEED